MTRIDVNPRILQWAQRRSGHSDTEMRNKFAAWDLWLQKEKDPTFAQLEDIAKYTHVPFGYFFLLSPPLKISPFQILGQVEERECQLVATFWIPSI